jgi:shikimate kinase
MNIIFIGYRCTGKTTIGKQVAADMGLPFYDTDALIEEQSGRTIREIVADEGWESFRKDESAVIRKLSAENGCVIALGGGAVLDEANVRHFKADGFFVWLTAGIDVIIRRMKDDGKSGSQRPALSEAGLYEEVAAVLEERRSRYEAAADIRIDTDERPIQEIAEEVSHLAVKRRAAITGGRYGG